MASKPKEPEPPRRLNRAVGVGEALSGVLDTALRKRGFASRDILTHWAAMAPKPYDTVALPDRLAWPRGAKGAEGATLYLRCAQGHALALAHEGPAIAAAVNRYFGYVLVNEVRRSLEPMPKAKEALRRAVQTVSPDVEAAVAEVENDAVRAALRGLGTALAGRKR
jgi:hypothetical protein